MTQRENYRVQNVLADVAKAYTYTPGRPADPAEARMLDRLSRKAVVLAQEYGVVLTHREALRRVRVNLAHVMAMAEDTGVREDEWLP